MAQTPDVLVALGGKMGHGYQHRPLLGWTTDPDTVLGCSPDLDVPMALVGSAGHSDWHEFSGSMAVEHQHGLRYGPRSQASALALDGNRSLRHKHRP